MLSPNSFDSVLRALSNACSDAWCYAPVNSQVLTHWSAEFLKLFGIAEFVRTYSPPVLSIRDPRFVVGCRHINLPEDWLTRQFEAGPESADDYVSTTFGSMRTTLKLIHDESKVPVGRLLLLRQCGGPGTLHSVWERGLKARQNLSVLSERESEILRLLSHGLTNKVVARQACISEKTVEKHRANIMRKLKVRSVADLIRRVTEASIIEENLLPAPTTNILPPPAQ